MMSRGAGTMFKLGGRMPSRGVATKFCLFGTDSAASNPLPPNSNFSFDFGHFISKILENRKYGMS